MCPRPALTHGCPPPSVGEEDPYYLEITSSWCFWVEPVWAELKQRYAGRVEFDWQIARMTPEDFPTSSEQYDWFLRRSSTVMRSPFMLNSAYYETPIPGGYPAASAVAVAARDLGATGDAVRLALSHAAYREGRKIGRLEVALEIAARVGGLDPAKLRARAELREVAVQMGASTTEFFAHQVTQRPTFVLTNAVGDKAVFSGLVRIEPLVATIETMLSDAAAYAAFLAQQGPAPVS